MTHGTGKSDSFVVPGKFPNKVSQGAAEGMEGRGLAKPVTLGVLVCASGWTAFRNRRALRSASPYLGFAAALFLTMSVAGSKREIYLVTLLPFAAVGSAIVLERWIAAGKLRRPAMGLLAAGAVAARIVFFARYEPNMEYSRRQKRAALTIRRDSMQHDVVWNVEIPVNVILFYSQRSVHYTGIDEMPTRLDDVPVAEGRPVYFVMRESTKKRVMQELAALGWDTAGAHLLIDERYVVARIERRNEAAPSTGIFASMAYALVRLEDEVVYFLKTFPYFPGYPGDLSQIFVMDRE